MEKEKFICEHVWCKVCRLEGNIRDEFTTLENYIEMGAPSPYLVGPQKEW